MRVKGVPRGQADRDRGALPGQGPAAPQARRVPVAPVGRPEAARGHRPGAVDGAPGAPVRRAHLRARPGAGGRGAAGHGGAGPRGLHDDRGLPRDGVRAGGRRPGAVPGGRPRCSRRDRPRWSWTRPARRPRASSCAGDGDRTAWPSIPTSRRLARGGRGSRPGRRAGRPRWRPGRRPVRQDDLARLDARSRGSRCCSAWCAFCSTSSMAVPSAWISHDGLEDELHQVGREAHRRLVEEQHRAGRPSAPGPSRASAARRRTACPRPAGRAP